MKIRLIDREVVDGRPRLTIQTRRWWQWRWRTEVWLRSRMPVPCPEVLGGAGEYWWMSVDGIWVGWKWCLRLNRINTFAENEEKRDAQLMGDNVVPIRREA